MSKQIILLVKPSKISIKTLQYIESNIDIINDMGIHIKIKKYTDKTLTKSVVSDLKKKGIDALPALIFDSKSIKVGHEQIVKIFESNIKEFKKLEQTTQPAANVDIQQPNSVENYWSNTLKDKSKDDVEDDIDIVSATRDAMARQPKHRMENKITLLKKGSAKIHTNNTDDDSDEEPVPKVAATRRPTQPRNRGQQEQTPNITPINLNDYNIINSNINLNEAAGGDASDQQMMEDWIKKTAL